MVRSVQNQSVRDWLGTMRSQENFVPDIVVGIDFGMTCTGVAYSWGPEWPDPRTIQHWPGKLGHEVRNKVDTAISYDTNTGLPTSWGFLVNRSDPDQDVEDLFKLYLDHSFEDEIREHVPVQLARKWLKDYLAYLYGAIVRFFDDSIPRWKLKNISFDFSVPTTWKDPGMVADIETIISSAGFCEHTNHRAQITLTEAEAAAVAIAKQNLERGDVYVICDAGGGTTDVNLLKITTAAFGQTVLHPLSWVEGKAAGSALIDFRLEKLIFERLEKIRHVLTVEPAKLAEKMVSDRFETYKCSFGADSYNVLDLIIPVPGLPTGMDAPHAGVMDGKMTISRSTVQTLFESQLQKMYALVDTQLERLQSTHPREKASYIVLAGGLGSSPYVKQQFRRRYQNSGTALQNAASLEVLSAAEPQLAVCHGLVIDRIQSLKYSCNVIPDRCSRISYGVLVRERYDPLVHLGEEVTVDPRDKTKWAERQIHWLLKQGERISVEEGVLKRYRIKLNLGAEKIPWKAQIVMSSLPASQLPRSMKNASNTKQVCIVEAVMNEADLKLKNRHWYNLGPQYYRAEFDVKAIIGAADLKFEIWGNSGQRLSRDHNEINITWSPHIGGD